MNKPFVLLIVVDDYTRHSKADIPTLLSDEDEIALKEAANGLLQFDAVAAEIMTGIERGDAYKLRPSTILALHKIALDGIDAYAGNWRPGDVRIGKSEHEPPHASIVPNLVEDMCDYVNDNWNRSNPVELSAYVLWRLCWIHPFTDGNGRTARAVSYMVLCISVGILLPGDRTIPEQIAENKIPYYDALEAADKANKKTDGNDVSALADHLHNLLANQLLAVHGKAKGDDAP